MVAATERCRSEMVDDQNILGLDVPMYHTTTLVPIRINIALNKRQGLTELQEAPPDGAFCYWLLVLAIELLSLLLLNIAQQVVLEKSGTMIRIGVCVVVGNRLDHSVAVGQSGSRARATISGGCSLSSSSSGSRS